MVTTPTPPEATIEVLVHSNARIFSCKLLD